MNAPRVTPAPSGSAAHLGPVVISGHSEMAQRTRELNWSKTDLGPMELWPESLLSAVNMMLSAPVPMQIFWGPHLPTFYNDALIPTFAEKHPGALGCSGREVWAEAWPAVGAQLEQVLDTGIAVNFQNVPLNLLRNGQLEEQFWSYSYSPLFDRDGNIAGLLDICTETTAVIRAEQGLRTQSNLLHAERERMLKVLQQAPMFFALLEGPDYIITMMNPLYTQLVGHRDVLGKSVREVIVEAADPGYFDLLDRVRTTGEPFRGYRSPLQTTRDDGSSPGERFIDFVYHPLREADGSIASILLLGVDVTDQRQSELALLQAEKLAAVGRLASTIAHEINNPLEAVTNLLYLVQMDETQSDSSREYLRSAERELSRISHVTSQTLRFHRKSVTSSWFRPAALIAEVLALYDSRLSSGSIEVHRDDTPELEIYAQEAEVRQVLRNLVGNAIDSIRAGGHVVLRTRRVTRWSTGEPGARVTVADTGTGMPTEVLRRLFEAFYTTKGISGSGLGLWVSHKIVQNHGGTLRVSSSVRPGRHGTVFQLWLPLEAHVSPTADTGLNDPKPTSLT